jgi:pteridine reductase
MNLQDRVVWITGAGRRLGRAIALAVSGRGAKVIVHYHRSEAEAQAVVAQIYRSGGMAHAVCGDVAKPEDCRRVAGEAYARFGRLDVLVNNAALFFKTPFPEVTSDDWEATLNVNLKGSFFCAQAAAGYLPDGGKIVNIADWSGVRPYVDYLPYCISKAGVIALTRGLARTLAPKIAVNAVAPGPVLLPDDFDDVERQTILSRTPLKRLGTPDDIVNAVLFLLEGTDFTTGSTLTIDGGRLIA